MKIDVVDIKGNKTGRSLDLPDEIFAVEANEHAIYLDVKQHLANRRQGTHKAKERGEVAGSRRKIKKQKGTGTARAGDIKSPIFRGGGRIFGPRPRNYSSKLNKKVRSLARKSALSVKANAGNLMVIEDFTFESPKTKEFASILSSLDLKGKKTLLVTGDTDKSVYLSSRNLQNTEVASSNSLCTYEIMHANTLILSEGAVEKLKTILA